MTTPPLIDRSLTARPWPAPDAASAAARVEGALDRAKRLDQALPTTSLEGRRASGNGLGERALGLAAGKPLPLLRWTGSRRSRAGVGEPWYWIRTDDLE